MEVHHVLRVGALHRDGEGLEGVEGERNQAPHRVVDGSPQESRLDLKLQEARITSVKSERKKKSIRAVPGYRLRHLDSSQRREPRSGSGIPQRQSSSAGGLALGYRGKPLPGQLASRWLQ